MFSLQELIERCQANDARAWEDLCTIVESASRLCQAIFSVAWRYDGEFLHYVASHNFTPEVLDHISNPKPPDRSVAAGRRWSLHLRSP